MTVAAAFATRAFAKRALRAMHAKDGDALCAALSKLGMLDDEYPALFNATTYWIDMLTDHMFAGARVPNIKLLGTAMVNPERGEQYVLGSAKADTEVPAEYRWSAEMISARLMMDADKFVQRWNDAPDDPEVFAQYLLAVLRTCVNTIAVETRGYGFGNFHCGHDHGSDAS